MDGKEFRNYSLYYDAGNRLSRWVAYPLNTKLNGSGSRNDQFEAVDPKIPYQYQPYTAKGWGVSGYDRGHQIPAADRYWTDAHRATFYPTNMTVQKSELNQRIWADLESKVRSWAGMCDTLYVVTGCVPGPEFITDRGGNQVNVPSAYYKALLRYDASSTIAKYMGVAFWFENREYSDAAIKDQAMTVDELESRLGMDFFVNLPDQYEQEAESTINAWWNLN